MLALVTDVPSLNWDSHKDKLEVYKQGPADETCDNPFKLATIKDENTALYSNLSRFSNEVVSMYKAAHTAQSFILVQLSQGPTDLDSPPDEHCFELFKLVANFTSLRIRMNTILTLLTLLPGQNWWVNERLALLPSLALDVATITKTWASASNEVRLLTPRTSSPYLPTCLRHMLTRMSNDPTTNFPLVLPNTALWHTLPSTGSTVRSAATNNLGSTIRTATNNLSRSTIGTALTVTEQSALTAVVRPHLRDAVVHAATGCPLPDCKQQLVLVLRKPGSAPVQLPNLPAPSPAVPLTHSAARNSAHALTSHLATTPRQQHLATLTNSLEHLSRADLLELINKQIVTNCALPLNIPTVATPAPPSTAMLLPTSVNVTQPAARTLAAGTVTAPQQEHQTTFRAPSRKQSRAPKPSNEPMLKNGNTNVTDFLNRTEKYFALAHIPHNEWIDRALLNITSSDVSNRWETFAASQPEPPSWQTFKQQIMIYTRGHSSQYKALDSLATCTQGSSSIDEYITRYSQLVTMAAQNSNDAHIIQGFIRGVYDDTFRMMISLDQDAQPWQSLTSVQNYASQLAVIRYPTYNNKCESASDDDHSPTDDRHRYNNSNGNKRIKFAN